MPCAPSTVTWPRSTASLEHLLDALARDEHHVERPDQVLAQRVAQLGDRLGRDVGALGGRLGGGLGRLRGALLGALLAAAGLTALACGGAARRGLRARVARLRGARAARLGGRLRAAVFLRWCSARHCPSFVLRRSAMHRTSLSECSFLGLDYGSLNRASDGSVIGEPDAAAVAAPRARARPRSRRRGALDPRRVRAPADGRSRPGAVGSPSPKRSREQRERLRVAARAQVEVPAEHERVAGRPLQRALRRRASSSAAAAVGRPALACRFATQTRPSGSSTRVQSIRRRSGRSASRIRRVSTILPGWRTRIWFEPPSLEASRSGLRSASRHCRAGRRLRDVSASAPLEPVRRASASNQRGGASWRSATSQSQPSSSSANSGQQRAVDLRVRGVALGQPEQPRAAGEEGRVGREVATVVEVPAEDSH